MLYLVDTNVLCESSKTKPNAKVIAWLEQHDARLHLSALSLGEMLMGIHLMAQSKRRQQIEKWYQRIERWSAGRILSIDAAVMHTWAALCAKHQKTGRKLPAVDSLMAATALHHQLTLVTRNTGDFPEDLPVLNPWKD
jgi:predicted nucleic acid-binding protein